MALFPAFLDTCCLYSATLNDTLLRIAEQHAFQPLWSADVLDELEGVLRREAGLSPEQAAKRVDAMRRAFPSAEVSGYALLIDSMTCDEKDRHVLAAAVTAVLKSL